MFDFPSAGEVLLILALVGSVLLTGFLTILKVFGVLLLSWWWVAAPLPCVLVLAIFCAGVLALFG